MKRKLPLFLILACSLLGGLGALSFTLANQVALELTTRAMRERVNMDLMRGFSPSGAAYFDGRAAGYESVASARLDAPHTAEFLQGVGEAFLQASELVRRAETTGSTDPVLPTP